MSDKKMKQCKQCGEIKLLEEYRQYYNRNKVKTPGFYRTCKTCESINQRHKYLNKKRLDETITEKQMDELQEIEALYTLLRESGLEPPEKKEEAPPVRNTVQNMLSKQREKLEQIATIDPGLSLDTPPALLEWLTKDISAYEEWELEDIFDELEDKYAPQIGVDPDNYKPIRDDQFRDVLNRIGKRLGAL